MDPFDYYDFGNDSSGMSDVTVDGADVSAAPASITPNPAVSGNTDFFGSLYSNLLQPTITDTSRAVVDQQLAVMNAKAQQKVNSYHQNDPSVGPNDPKAAQMAASQTLAQRWLPSFMLTTTSPTVAGGTPQQKVNLFGFVAVGVVVLGLIVWIARRR